MTPDSVRRSSSVVIASLISTALVVVGFGDLPYGYYMLLRLFLCGVSLFFLFGAGAPRSDWQAWLLGGLAVLYNPVLPIRIGDKGVWAILNVVTVAVFWIIGSQRHSPWQSGSATTSSITEVNGPATETVRLTDGEVATIRKRAEEGHAAAEYFLGQLYQTGDGVRQDSEEAIKWYVKAARQGNETAQYSLGLMYQTGDGVRQDNAEAVKWYLQSANQNHWESQRRLGLMYRDGRGVTQDYVEAHKWLNIAASQVMSDVAGEEQQFIDARDSVAKLMTPSQVGEAQRLAKEWMEANRGNATT